MKPECSRTGESRFQSRVVRQAEQAKAQKNAKRVPNSAPSSVKPPPKDGVGERTSSNVAR